MIKNNGIGMTDEEYLDTLIEDYKKEFGEDSPIPPNLRVMPTTPASFTDLRREWKNNSTSTPIPLGDYRSGGRYVQPGISPTSGPISINDFRGKSAIYRTSWTSRWRTSWTTCWTAGSPPYTFRTCRTESRTESMNKSRDTRWYKGS